MNDLISFLRFELSFARCFASHFRSFYVAIDSAHIFDRSGLSV